MVSLVFALIVSLLGFGIGGIWPFIVCQKKRSGTASSTLGACDGDNTTMLWVLSITSLALMAVIMIVLLVLMCMYCSQNIGYVWVYVRGSRPGGGTHFLMYKGTDANEERAARGMAVNLDETMGPAKAGYVINPPPPQGGNHGVDGYNLKPYNDDRSRDRSPYRDERPRDYRDDRPYRDDHPRDYRPRNDDPRDHRPRDDYYRDRRPRDDRPRDGRRSPPNDDRSRRPLRGGPRGSPRPPPAGPRPKPSAPPVDQQVEQDKPPTYLDVIKTSNGDPTTNDKVQKISDGDQTKSDGDQTASNK